MKKFLIRREMEGAGSIPKHDLNSAGKGSEEVLEAMRSEGKNIMQAGKLCCWRCYFLHLQFG